MCSFFLLISLLLVAVLGVFSLALAAQSTPFRVNGTVESNGAVWHSIGGVRENELVLVSVSGSNVFNSELSFPNLTVCASSEFSRSHVYQFNASVSGSYLLKLSSWTGLSSDYSIVSSNEISDNAPVVDETPDVSPTPTPTTTPTVKPTPEDSVPIVAISSESGDSVKFDVLTSVSKDDASHFVFDMGDGTVITTSDRSVSHTYETPGNFTVNVSIPEVSGERIVQSYAVTVNPKPASTIEITPLIAAGITAGVGSVTAILLFFLKQRAKIKED
jgi:hypothetical protein